MSRCPQCGSLEVEVTFPANLASAVCSCRDCGYKGVLEIMQDDYAVFAKKLEKAKRG